MKNIFTFSKAKIIFCFILLANFTAKSQTLSFTINPNLQCLGNPTVHVYAGVTATAAGATSYSWSILTNSGQPYISWGVNGFNAQAWGMNLGSSGTITCYAYNNNTNAFITSATQTYFVGPLQNPVNFSVTASSNTFCAGNSITLTASGSTSYYWPSLSISGNSVVVTPTASTCYVVSSNATCTNPNTVCVTMIPLPTINIVGNNTVCLGSSITLSASGGQNYVWSNSSNSPTINFIPLNSSTMMVSGSGINNNCTSTSVFSYTVDNNCAIVWPGDANRDGQVTNADVFEIGLASGSTGAARTPASTSWNGQFASAWTGNVSTGWNKAHADCNGDGSINSSDLGAITSNFGLTHAFKNADANSGVDLVLSPQNSEVYGGVWNAIDILLGDVNNSQSQIYGAGFDLTFDQSMVQTDSVKIVYTPSFLNASNQNIEFEKTFFNNGKSYAASVRVDHADVSGHGKIAELWVKLKANNTNNSTFNFSLINGKKVTTNGVSTPLSTSGAMNLNLNNNATGFKEKQLTLNNIHFYPNPTTEKIILLNDLNTKTTYRLIDLFGRIILSDEFNSKKTLDVSSINKGVYFIEFETAQGKSQKKLVKE